MSISSSNTSTSNPFKIMDIPSYVARSTVGRFVLTFLALHTAHFMTVAVYSNYCLDISFFGYFANMINGHGPVCHALMMIAYHAQHNIYSILGTAAVGVGITWLTENMFSEPKTK